MQMLFEENTLLLWHQGARLSCLPTGIHTCLRLIWASIHWVTSWFMRTINLSLPCPLMLKASIKCLHDQGVQLLMPLLSPESLARGSVCHALLMDLHALSWLSKVYGAWLWVQSY